MQETESREVLIIQYLEEYCLFLATASKKKKIPPKF